MTMILNENTMTRLKKILLGQDERIKSFVIGTCENPMGNQLSSKENKVLRDEFEDELKKLNIQFIKIIGSYGNKEHSYILPNLDLDICKEIFGYNGYDQESFIYGETNSNGVDYYYWEKNEGDSPYILKDCERGITMMDDAIDYFSSKKSWKFKIDFSIFRETKEDVAKKRLLPITMTYSDDNTWTLSSSEEGYGSYAIKTTPDRMRKALLRMKFKNQDNHANSKRTVKYMDIVDDLMNKGNSTCYCWKSYYPKTREDFERLTNG